MKHVFRIVRVAEGMFYLQRRVFGFWCYVTDAHCAMVWFKSVEDAVSYAQTWKSTRKRDIVSTIEV